MYVYHAHELLGFLLDGLSEDLNLVHEKPYTEMPNSDGMRSESELAHIWWETHLKRDRKVI
jgi:ubiquitin C-terminal hydrolase